MEFSALSGSQPRLQLLRPRADTQCCPAGYTVPPCRGCNPKTQQCLQGFPTNCQCPYNYCANIDGASSGGGGGALGGALGGVLGALALAVALFLFWRQKRHRAKLLQARVKADAKVRAAAAEKFRPGREGAASAAGHLPGQRPISVGSSKRSARLSAGAIGGAATAPGSGAAGGTGSSHGHGSANSATARLSTPDPFADPEHDEDTEWTVLRADGLTTFKKTGEDGEAEEEEMLDGLGALVNRRHSTGAATHLSRITEGVEEDEDERRSLAPTIRSSFRMSHGAPPMPADAVSLAQQAAGMFAAAPSLRPHSALSTRTGSSASGELVFGPTTTVYPQPGGTAATTTATSLALPINSLTGGGSGNLLVPRGGGSQPNPNRLSTLTTATGISMASSIGDFVISTPQTVTPESAKRVQLGQSKPQLVRSLSNGDTKASSSASAVAGGAGGAGSQDDAGSVRSAHLNDELEDESVKDL